jgi:hypothetical protein
MQSHRRAADVQMLGDCGKRYKLIGGHRMEISDSLILAILNDDFSYPYI